MFRDNYQPFQAILLENVKKKKLTQTEQKSTIEAIKAIKKLDKIYQKNDLELVAIYSDFNQESDYKIEKYTNENILDAVDQGKETALMHAAKNGHMDIVAELIESKASLDQSDFWGHTALFKAEKEGYFPVFNLLLEKKASLFFKNNLGVQILNQAARYGHVEHVKKLIELNVFLDEQDFSGKTALITASSNDHIDVVLELIAAKASLDIQEQMGGTALSFSLLYPNIVSLLIEKGASINIQNNNKAYPQLLGRTALMHATGFETRNKKGETSLELLIAAKADIDLVDNLKWNALEYAVKAKNLSCISALLCAGSKIINSGSLYKLLFISSQDSPDCDLMIAMSELLKQKNIHSQITSVSDRAWEIFNKQFQIVSKQSKEHQVDDEQLESATNLPRVLRNIVQGYDCGFDRNRFFNNNKNISFSEAFNEKCIEPLRKKCKFF